MNLFARTLKPAPISITLDPHGDPRLPQCYYLALQRWAAHIARLALVQEGEARRIATRAVDDIIAHAQPLPPRERAEVIRALTHTQMQYLAVVTPMVQRSLAALLTDSPALAPLAAALDERKENQHG